MVPTAHAEGDTQESPSIDLVAMFGNAPDITAQGQKLGTIMNVKYKRVQIRDVYNDIYYRGVEPNQIVCRSTWYFDENTSKAVPTVMWSVWYRPSAMVSKLGTECVDTKVEKKFLDKWAKQGYRWLGSGTEPHMGLLWLGHWTEIQKGYSPSKAPMYKWCKALEFSYAQNMSSETIWTEIYKKSVFDYTQASSALALVSRDVTCTGDVKVYGKWMRTPGWSYVFINP
jgi:hypothetical protein